MISYLLKYQGTLNPYSKRTSGEILENGESALHKYNHLYPGSQHLNPYVIKVS